jgi:RNA-directed DNA polymerase
VRIVKAWQEGRRHKVKALQRLLVRSLSGKSLAVRRVTENQGKRTPGVDPTPRTVLVRACQHLWLALYNDGYGDSLPLTLPRSLAP